MEDLGLGVIGSRSDRGTLGIWYQVVDTTTFPGWAELEAWLDGLPTDRRLVFTHVTSTTFEKMLIERNFYRRIDIEGPEMGEHWTRGGA